MSQKGTISKSDSGLDLVVEWKIEFFTLGKWDGEYYWSPNFSFGGVEWYLGIFPNGSSKRDSSGHVGLNLCKWPSSRSVKQSFSLSLKTVKGEKYNEKQFTKDFEYRNLFHEINRFISRSVLTRRRSELVPEGVLTVICTMKNTTCAGSDTRDNPEHDYVGASQRGSSTQRVEPQRGASTQRVEPQRGASTQRVKPQRGASTQRVEVSIQTVEASIQTVEASTQTVEVKCEASASGTFPNLHANKLHHDFKELFLKKEDCDVTIKVEGSEFPAHRVILKARSPVFASTFRHDMKENATGIVEIDDCDPSSFSDFLCFLYCGDASIISQENVFGLFRAADKYQILDLRSNCLEFIKKNLTVDTFCETISLALRHSETELIKLSTDYFKKTVPKIIVTVKWQTFLAENPTESNELLIKFFVPNSS